MTDTIENLVLEQLRLIRADQASMKTELREVKHLLATLEAGQGSLLQHLGHQSSAIAQLQLSDRIGERVERIERCLELADTQ